MDYFAADIKLNKITAILHEQQNQHMFPRLTCFSLLTFFLFPFLTSAQTTSVRAVKTEGNSFSLRDCIAYALKNQPALNQSKIDEEIARTNKGIALSGWMPQIAGAANYQHYIQLPTAFFRTNGNLTSASSGVSNSSTPQIAVTQNIFSNDALQAAKASRLGVMAARENTEATKIELVSNVSKAFYDVLLSIERINVYREDTARLRKNQGDAYYRYMSGIADKVDYKQATIALNNSLAQLKTASEEINAKYAVLKLMIGYPSAQPIEVTFDTARMMRDIYVDTLAQLRIDKRVEFRELQLARSIQHQTTMYYHNGFIPSLSAFYNYNYQFLSNSNSDLYAKAYPNSLYGIQLSLPIFSGLKRIQNLRKARLQEERIDWDEVNLRLGIDAQYKQALAGYKSSIYYLHTQAENVNMAREVYNIVKLQYSEGVKAYLDVIVAETDLQTSEINYLNSLFQVLESKLDLERAMGDIVAE